MEFDVPCLGSNDSKEPQHCYNQFVMFTVDFWCGVWLSGPWMISIIQISVHDMSGGRDNYSLEAPPGYQTQFLLSSHACYIPVDGQDVIVNGG